MPIEIRELTIKTSLSEGAGGTAESSTESDEDRLSIIQECVDRVLSILKDKAER